MEKEFKHFQIVVEPNNTIGLYLNGKSVRELDLWIETPRVEARKKVE